MGQQGSSRQAPSAADVQQYRARDRLRQRLISVLAEQPRPGVYERAIADGFSPEFAARVAARADESLVPGRREAAARLVAALDARKPGVQAMANVFLSKGSVSLPEAWSTPDEDTIADWVDGHMRGEFDRAFVKSVWLDGARARRESPGCRRVVPRRAGSRSREGRPGRRSSRSSARSGDSGADEPAEPSDGPDDRPRSLIARAS